MVCSFMGLNLTVVYRVRFLYLVVLKWRRQQAYIIYRENLWVRISSLVLFLPSFSRGLVFSSSSINFCFYFFSRLNLKWIVLYSLVSIFLILILWSIFSRFYFLEWLIRMNYSWFSMFIIPRFRRKLSKPYLFKLRLIRPMVWEIFFFRFFLKIKSFEFNSLNTKYEVYYLYKIISIPIVRVFCLFLFRKRI